MRETKAQRTFRLFVMMLRALPRGETTVVGIVKQRSKDPKADELLTLRAFLAATRISNAEIRALKDMTKPKRSRRKARE